MSRWAKTFATLSGASDTLDTMRHSEQEPATVSQSVNSVTALPEPKLALRSLNETQREQSLVQIRAGERGRLRDGRWLHRFVAAEIPSAGDPEAAELMAVVRHRGAILVADGATLVMVEPGGLLSPELLRRLADLAGAVIACLRGEHRLRTE